MKRGDVNWLIVDKDAVSMKCRDKKFHIWMQSNIAILTWTYR